MHAIYEIDFNGNFMFGNEDWSCSKFGGLPCCSGLANSGIYVCISYRCSLDELIYFRYLDLSFIYTISNAIEIIFFHLQNILFE